MMEDVSTLGFVYLLIKVKKNKTNSLYFLNLDTDKSRPHILLLKRTKKTPYPVNLPMLP